MTKTSIKKELQLKNVWNRVKDINGVRVGAVMWHNNSWKVIQNDATFDDISDEENEQKVIKKFYYQEDLANYLLELFKNN